MRDVFGRPYGLHIPSPRWGERRAPVRPAPLGPVPLRPVPVGPAPLRPSPDRHLLEADPPPRPAPPARDEAPPSREAPGPEPVPTTAAQQLAEARAELEATRARLAREATREREAEKLRLAGEILPALDDLDRCIAGARQEGSVSPAVLEGFELARARLERVLGGYGLERIQSVGARFDPAQHEAIALVEVDDPDRAGTIVDELERGYRAGDRVVRAARVRVGAAA
jgi:molecular chaperone GrpE